MAPHMCRSTNRRGGVEDPEVWFRILHIAQDGRNGGSAAAYFQQSIEIALGPKGAFENANVGALTRQVHTCQIVRAIPSPRDKPKPPREPKTPRVAEFLRKAIEWQRQLHSGEVRKQADIARREGVTRARVTQVMGMLRLAPEIQEQILSMPDAVPCSSLAERMLRPIETITDVQDQVRAFRKLLV